MHPARTLLLLLLTAPLATCGAPSLPERYPLHHAITATLFWAGEKPAKGPANVASAWDQHWVDHYGGPDDPAARDGLLPAKFHPRQNPFYIALPYNDLGKTGRKPDAATLIPWAAEHPAPGKWQSLCKDRWVRITANGKTCYAQWEDVGPFETDDSAYVFGNGKTPPKNRQNDAAGIDCSPAVSAFLGTAGMGKVDWQFVDDPDVSVGPWSEIITRTDPPQLAPLPSP